MTVRMVLSICCALSCLNAEDLLDIYNKAKKEDQVFASAYQSFLAVGERLPQARAGLLPTIALNGNTSEQKGKSSFNYEAYTNRDIQNWGVNLQLTQPIFRVQNWALYKQAGYQIKQAEAELLKAKQDLILRVAQAYFDMLVSKDSVEVYEAQIKAVKRQLEAAEKNYEAGITTITDVHEAKARLDISSSGLIAAQKDLEDKKAALGQIVGSEVNSVAPLQEGITISRPIPENITEWTANAVKNSPIVISQQAGVEIASYEVTKNRSAHLPTLDLTASYGENYASGSMASPSDIKSRYKAGQIGLQFSMPIFSGGSLYSKTEEAEIGFAKARLELENAKRSAVTNTKQAFYGMMNGVSQVTVLTSAVENSKSAVEDNKIGYKIGVRINTDVLNAEQQLASTKRDLTRAKYETLLYGLKLKASVGILSDNDIAEINGMLATTFVKYSSNKHHKKGKK
ncbi:MAG: TolC family outer membrane protein [Campylobacterales bacterium]|nr:TolC family outer membrane protein [Campylobacterales bacterium]